MESGDYLNTRVFFREHLNEGYSLREIRKHLIAEGVDKKLVREVEDEFNKDLRVWIGFGLLVSIILVGSGVAFLLLT